ncbi:MAG: HD domain-containing protein [Lachnospiraceae bacterium]|nr:HD domain-containing protein [Lachnospiraceae bacterium]
MDRMKMVQEYVDDILQSCTDKIERACRYKHLYGVSQACAMLAMKRNENVELAAIAGLLHDIYRYKLLDSTDHAHKGALLAEDILCSIGSFARDKISQAIYNHSDKADTGALFDEILKDADVLQYCLYNPLAPVAEHEKDRFMMLKEELS